MTSRTAPAPSRSPSVFLGGPTVLTVLLSLCLCCFCLLTWYRARTDYGYALRSAQTVEEFYAADSRCDALLARLAPLASSDPDAAGSAMARLLEEEGLTPNWDPYALALTFALPAGAQGDLHVTLILDENPFRVLSRRVFSQDYAAQDNTLPVFQEFPDFI